MEKIYAKVISDPSRGLLSFGKNKEDNDKLTILRKDFDDIAVTAIENAQEIIEVKNENAKLDELSDHLVAEHDRFTKKVIPELERRISTYKNGYDESEKKRRDLAYEKQSLELKIAKVPRELWEQYNPPPPPPPQQTRQTSRSNRGASR